jgi:hypothetical protein
LVRPGDKEDQAWIDLSRLSSILSQTATSGNLVTAPSGIRTAFIGGGCCVHISVEYTPTSPTVDSSVLIVVQDSERTLMAWERRENAGTHYQIKEGIITMKPGAAVGVVVSNMIAKIRWCEGFSC